MEEYLITARSVTHAQRMAQALERRGVRAVVARAPMGLTGKAADMCCGCGAGNGRRQRCGCCGRRALRPHRCFAGRTTDSERWSYDLF